MAGGNEDVRLLGAWPSPFAMRPRFALNLKKVPYEFVQVNPFEKGELLLKSNPVYKKIPVLLHGDRAICESMIIVEYIDGVWKNDGPSIVSSDPYDHAMARFWATYADDKFFPNLRGMAGAETAEDAAKAADQLFESLQLLEGAFEKCSKGKAFFGGDTIGFLDISLGGYIAWIRAAEKMSGIEFFDKEKIPLLTGWAERFCADEAAREVVPDTDKLVEFFQTFLVKMMKGGKPPSQ